MRRMAGLPAAQGSSTLHGGESTPRESEQEHLSGQEQEDFPENLAELRATLGVITTQEVQNALRAHVAFSMMSEEFLGVQEVLGSFAASVGAKRHSTYP